MKTNRKKSKLILDKIKIAKLENLKAIQGGDTTNTDTIIPPSMDCLTKKKSCRCNGLLTDPVG